jgi:arylsulfate sulfotransferase
MSISGCGFYLNAPRSGTSEPPPTQPPPTAAQTGSVTISPQYAAVGTGQMLQFHATSGGSLRWRVNGVQGGNANVGTVDSAGNYSAPASLPQSLNVTLSAELANSPRQNIATAVVSVINPGVVFTTANPQVALYSIYLPSPGQVYVEFGTTTDYGLPTWTQPTPSQNGGLVNIYVAGMRANTRCHMRARVTLNNGALFTDVDQTFNAGAAPATASVAASTENGQTPQSGIELFATAIPHEAAQAFATDLEGNVIWTYTYLGSGSDVIQPIKMLPNGHFLVLISYASSLALKGVRPSFDSIDEVREVDLAGNTVRSITQAQLASALDAQGYSLTLGSLHHDVLPLPNGHLVFLATVTKSFDNLPGYPGTTNVLGDLLIDVDQNSNPDWVWNSFDHLDVNRHPYLFPDWTHSNSILYSADDHNLLLSLRHQNWLVKIDFANGQGSGDVLWRLGEGGDFTLLGGTDPTDWFYAQHGPSYFSPNTTGVFELGIMDNGDDRQFAKGVMCGTGPIACLYSTVPVLRIDETAMTATIVFHYIAPPALYSFFGGNVNLLPNGDLEADLCAVQTGSVIQEWTMSGNSQQLVWQAVTKGAYQYRADRIPSLYPGVQW